MSDQDLLLDAIEDAKRILADQALLISTLHETGRIIGEYIEPGPRDAEKLTRLIAVLETQDLARAIERLEKGHGFQVVK